MPSFVPPKKNVEFIFYMGLVSQANTKIFQATPTLATGDFKVSKDGAALTNLTTLPVVTPAGGKMVKVTLSLNEMNADNVTLVASDAAGNEWADKIINIHTAANQLDDVKSDTAAILVDTAEIGAAGAGLTDVGGMSTAMKAEVNAEVVDVLVTDTHAEVAGVPAATSSLKDKICWLFTLARNKITQTSTTQTLRNNADSANVATSTVSDAAGTFTRDKWI